MLISWNCWLKRNACFQSLLYFFMLASRRIDPACTLTCSSYKCVHFHITALHIVKNILAILNITHWYFNMRSFGYSGAAGFCGRKGDWLCALCRTWRSRWLKRKGPGRNYSWRRWRLRQNSSKWKRRFCFLRTKIPNLSKYEHSHSKADFRIWDYWSCCSHRRWLQTRNSVKDFRVIPLLSLHLYRFLKTQ